MIRATQWRHRDPVDMARLAQGEWLYDASSDADKDRVVLVWLNMLQNKMF